MRRLAIGDIHGCLTALATLAKVVDFQPEDMIVTLGDYVDRGPDTRGVIDWLLEYRRTNPGRLIALRGNHELMMSKAKAGGVSFYSWHFKGGRETLLSYGVVQTELPDSINLVPDEHWRFLEEELVPYHETETHIFAHACASSELPLSRQTPYQLYWERFEFPDKHISGKTLICGHTSQHSGLPLDRGHAVCIDTRAFGGRWLTCLDVDTRRYWQANQLGESREGVLELQAV